MLLERYYCLIISLLIGLSVSAQQVSVTELPTQELLPVAHIHRIFQDSEGYMWYATESGGLCRDNGYQIDVFRSDLNTPRLLASNSITCVAEDVSRKIWFGTERGLYILDKKNYHITQLPGGELREEKIGSILPASDGTVWISDDTGIYRYSSDGEKLGSYPSRRNNRPVSVSDFYEDSHHHIWALQWGGTVLQYHADVDSFAVCKDWPDTVSPVQMVEDIHNRCYWIATWGEGVVQLVPSDESGTEYTYRPQPATLDGVQHNPHRAQVLGVWQDSSQGLLWVSAMDNLYVYQTSGGKLQPVSTETFLPKGNKILDRVIEDRQGNIWVPGYSPHTFILSFEKNKILREPVSAMMRQTGYPVMADRVLKEDNYYWIWQGRTGLSLYDSTLDRISFISDIPEIAVAYAISKPIEKCRTRKGIWAFHADRLLHIQHADMNMLLKEEIRIPDSSHICALHEDDRNRLWIGAGNVLYRYATLGGKMDRICGNMGGTVEYIAVSQNDYAYCVTSGREFVRVAPDGIPEVIGQGEDFSSVTITPDGMVWTATLQGSVYSYNPRDRVFRFEEDASNRNGDGVKGLEADDSGHLWILSDQYVKEYNPANRSFRILRNSDRLMDVDYFLSIGKMEDGQICLGGIGAFCQVASSAGLNQSPDGLKPLVSALKIDGVRRLTGMDKREVEIAPDETSLEVSFSTLDHLHARKISYAYRLKGWEETWTYLPQGVNSAYFTKLPRGNYSLEIKATDVHGCWGEPVVCLEIDRLPAWYETWWAYTLYTLAGLALLAGIWWLDNRIRYLLSLQQKRKEILLTGVEVHTEDMATSGRDEEFLRKAVAHVERNMDNSSYSVELLSEDLCMSRMNLYRKLQLLTGQKPTEFIRDIRLKRAARLLAETNLSVVEIAEKVGFSTPSYFTKCFKEMFGVLPTQYGK